MKLHLYIMWVMYSLALVTMAIAITFALDGNNLGTGLGLFEAAVFTLIGYLAEFTYNKSKIK